jgi:NADPH-dependent 7-cyano-7-deazaguanine reductase QueF
VPETVTVFFFSRSYVSKFRGSSKFRRRRIHRIFKNLVKSGKAKKISAEMKVSRERNRKNLKIQNLAGLTKLSTDFSKKTDHF